MNFVLPALGVVLITLKLLGDITLSWVWVLAPFWIVPALLLLMAAVVAIVAGLRGTRSYR